MSKLLRGLRLCDVHVWQSATAVSVGKAFEESVMAQLQLFDLSWSVQLKEANFHHKSDKKTTKSCQAPYVPLYRLTSLS